MAVPIKIFRVKKSKYLLTFTQDFLYFFFLVLQKIEHNISLAPSFQTFYGTVYRPYVFSYFLGEYLITKIWIITSGIPTFHEDVSRKY